MNAVWLQRLVKWFPAKCGKDARKFNVNRVMESELGDDLAGPTERPPSAKTSQQNLVSNIWFRKAVVLALVVGRRGSMHKKRKTEPALK